MSLDSTLIISLSAYSAYCLKFDTKASIKPIARQGGREVNGGSVSERFV